MFGQHSPESALSRAGLRSSLFWHFPFHSVQQYCCYNRFFVEKKYKHWHFFFCIRCVVVLDQKMKFNQQQKNVSTLKQ